MKAHASSTWIAPLLAVLAAALGLAAAWADGVTLPPLKAIAALLLAAPAWMGFVRTTRRIAEDGAAPASDLIFGLLLPALFLLLLACGTDHFVRGAWSWTAFATALPFVLLATALPLAERFTQRAADLDAGRRSLAAAIAPNHAKLWLFGLSLPPYLWLVLQVGRDALPQACAAALLTLLLSLPAARKLQDMDDQDELQDALRLSALAAAAHGLILIAALTTGQHWPVF